jgi:hypothetical protein
MQNVVHFLDRLRLLVTLAARGMKIAIRMEKRRASICGDISWLAGADQSGIYTHCCCDGCARFLVSDIESDVMLQLQNTIRG